MHRFVPSFGALAVVGVVAGCGQEMVGPPESTVTESFAHVPAAAAAGSHFVAPLGSAEEVPEPDLTATRNPRGMAHFGLDPDAGELDFRLIVANIENVTQAHIHCGPAGEAGPVVAFLFGFIDGGVSANGVLAEGTVASGDVIERADSEVCPGGVATFDDMLAQMRDGNAYVNVHTVQNPAGEIRGQIRGTGSH